MVEELQSVSWHTDVVRKRDVLRSPKPIVKEGFSVLCVLTPRLFPPPRQRTTQIRFRQSLSPIPTRAFQQLPHQSQIRPTLIRLQRDIPPRQTRIMLNLIMPTQLLQIKCTAPIPPSQEISRELGHEEAETRSEVEGLADRGGERAEGDGAT